MTKCLTCYDKKRIVSNISGPIGDGHYKYEDCPDCTFKHPWDFKWIARYSVIHVLDSMTGQP